MAFSKSVIRSQMPINCNLCETEKNIRWKCLTCGVLMCSTCKDKIHLRIGKDHKVVNIKNVGLPIEELDFKNIKCQEHSEQSTCLFCTKCNALVCPTCVAKVHTKHDLIEISNAYNLKIDKLKKELSRLHKEKDEITATKTELNLLKTAENTNYKKVSTDILKHEEIMKETVEKFIGKLKNELDQIHEASSKSNEESINAISESENQINEKYSDVQNFINTTDVTEFFQVVSKFERSKVVSIPKPKILRSSTLQFIPEEFTQSNIGVIQSIDIPLAEVKVSLSIINEYKTNLSYVSYLCACPDDSLWMASCHADMDGVVRNVKTEGFNLETQSTYNIKVVGMALSASHDLLLVPEVGSKLKMITSTTNRVTDTIYDIYPFEPVAIHVGSGGQIIVGGILNYRGAVHVIKKNGDHEAVYENDKHNQPIFKYPRNITTTSNGNIHVVDYIAGEESGKLVVLGVGGNVINIYKGNADINKKKPFKPAGIITTPRDNVIVVDVVTQILCIMNNSGQLIAYIKTNDSGVECPFSVAINQTGQLYIGCTRMLCREEKEAKLFKVNIIGC
ncbi:Hypothetical predicted protein [Mytilus galloprovincialis]|uniref:B box-type domain-containing protein n=1 Tax=Mytilus galloprovincialis TaxID=29158 RepID=A0A8B6GZT1_MYTGA|nr:Hypothetical predicted protein [Mytilus galloprovincialis]